MEHAHDVIANPGAAYDPELSPAANRAAGSGVGVFR
jgi:hypothetical protein